MENKTLGMMAIILSIISLIVAGIAVWTPGTEGPQGEKGQIGPMGPQGKQGIQGINGTNAPINKLPTIRLVTQSGNYVGILPSILHICKYTYDITIYADDSDDSNIRVSFYYKTNLVESWNQGDIYYGGNGEYSSTIVYPFENIISSKLTNYWLVEVWDGSNIVISKYSYSIIP